MLYFLKLVNLFIFSEIDESDTEDLLKKTGNYLAQSDSLAQGVIQLKRCTDANKEQKSRASHFSNRPEANSLKVRRKKIFFLESTTWRRPQNFHT